MLDICIPVLGGCWWLVFGFGFPKSLEVTDLFGAASSTSFKSCMARQIGSSRFNAACFFASLLAFSWAFANFFFFAACDAAIRTVSMPVARDSTCRSSCITAHDINRVHVHHIYTKLKIN